MNKKWKFFFAVLMLVIPIFMALSYHQLIESSEADRLSQVAYHVWLFSLPVWSGFAVYQYQSMVKKKN